MHVMKSIGKDQKHHALGCGSRADLAAHGCGHIWALLPSILQRRSV